MKKSVQKKETSDKWKSFYFIWNAKKGYPLYVGVVLEDRGEMIFCWLLNRRTNESREIEIKKSLVKFDNKYDIEYERN